MISIYNKAILKELNPALLEKLEELETEGLKKARVLPSKSGEKTLAYEENGKTYFLHSRYQPSYEAEKAADSYADITNEDSVVFYGVGLGYHIKEMLKRVPEIKYYLIEPNLEVLYVFLEHNELKDMELGNLEGITIDFGDLEQKIPHILIKYSQEIKLVLHYSCVKYFEEYFEQFRKLFLGSFRREKDRTIFFALEQLKTVTNEFDNMMTVIESANILNCDLEDIKGKTAIIVAAGPSLDDEIENIREIKKRGMAYILAVGSGVNSLLSQGIHADAVFSYDPSVENQKVLKKIKEENIKDIPLIFGAGIGSESLKDYPGPKICMLNSHNYIIKHYLKSKTKDMPIVGVGATITVSGLDAALKMGFKQVILVGQNLGITEDKSYSSGIEYAPTEIVKESQYTELEKDVHGNTMKTSTAYLMMREGIEEVIEISAKDAKVWNATRKGLAIKGAEFKALAELMKEMEPNSVTGRWLETTAEDYDLEYLAKQKEEMFCYKEEVDKQVQQLDSILEDLKKNSELNLYKKLKPLYTKLNLNLKRLEKNKFSVLFVLPSMIQEYHNLIRRIEYFNSISDKEEQSRSIYKEFKEFRELYKERLKVMEKYFETLNNQLEDYLKEKKEIVS
ncbi:DUF115 domain-containing protein [Clostridiales bacterium COT073_COT-073]|nr:DUF115 domain-containing protein [Clostridiales bacterium COT073_COT-073]